MFLRIKDNKSIPVISIKNVELIHFELPVGVFKFETIDDVHVISVNDEMQLETFLGRFDFRRQFDELREYKREKKYKTNNGI